MNEQDKAAFEAALLDRCRKVVTVPQDFGAGWQAALEYARSQPAQEPVAWRGPNWGHGPEQYSYRDYDDPMLDTRGNIVGEKLYTEPPTVAINEQILEALKPFAALDLRGDNLGGRDDSQPVYARDKTVLTVGDFKRAQAAIEAAEKAKGSV